MKIHWAQKALLAAVASLPLHVHAEETPQNIKPALVVTEEKPSTPDLQELINEVNKLKRSMSELREWVKELRKIKDTGLEEYQNAVSKNWKSVVAIQTNLKVITQPNGTQQTEYTDQGSGIVIKTNLGTLILANVHSLLDGILMEDFLKKSIPDQKASLLQIAKNSKVSIILPNGEEVEAKVLLVKEKPLMHAFRDVLLLKPNKDISSETTPANLSEDLPKPGTLVIICGNTLAGHHKIPLLTSGAISAVGDYHPFSMERHEVGKINNTDDFSSYTISNAPVLPGNSGGPMIGVKNSVCYGMVCHQIEETLSKSLSAVEIREWLKENEISLSPLKK